MTFYKNAQSKRTYSISKDRDSKIIIIFTDNQDLCMTLDIIIQVDFELLLFFSEIIKIKDVE